MPGHDRRRTRPPAPGEIMPGKRQNPLFAARERAKADLAREQAAKNTGAKPAGSKPKGKPATDAPAAVKAPPAPQLDGEGRPYITLAQLLKKLNLADTGGAAKHLVREGGITVNGEAEVRPGRKLHQGDSVVVAGQTVAVSIDR